jgi:Ni/Co efflux regulator RcnB
MKRFSTAAAAGALGFALLAPASALAQQDQHMRQGGLPDARPTQSRPAAPRETAQHAPMPVENHGGMASRAPDQHGPTPQRPPMREEHAQMGEHHQWHNGDHYDGNRDVVHDWGQYHLHQPPPGYEWVQDGNQYVLIAITSGIIADIFLNAANP